MDWIHLARDRDKRRATVHTVKTGGLHKMRIVSRLAQTLFVSQEGLCYLGLVSQSDSQYPMQAYPDTGKNL